MAEPGDHLSFSASFSQLDSRLQQAIEVVDSQLAKVVAAGDEAMATVLRTQLEELKKWSSRTPAGVSAAQEAPQIEKATAALDRENAAKERGLNIDRERIATVAKETQALIDRAAVAQRLAIPAEQPGGYVRTGPYSQLGDRAAAQRLIIPSEQPGYVQTGPYSQLASQQAAREAELSQYQRRVALLAQGGIDAEMQRALALQPHPMSQTEGAARLVLPPERRGGAYEQLQGAQAEAEARTRALAIEREQLRVDQERVAQQQLVNHWLAEGQAQAARYAVRGQVVPSDIRQGLIAGPQGAGGAWGAAEKGAQRAGIAEREYATLTARASTSTEALTNNMTRLGMAEAESSNALRRHGALTTEYLQALARGETTVREFGYQLGATIGKFAGWTAAAAAVYGTIGVFSELRKGAADGASGVEQLRRTINDLDTTQARQAIESLSQGTNVSVKEAGDAIFQYSRVFHTLGDATMAAHYGLGILKLDNVSLADSVALSTGIHQQWGRTAEGLIPIWNMLAAGQREYNARISQTTTILRGAQSAVRQSGGDLNQLVQLSVLGAQALPGQPGQVATALSRSATTYARQNLPTIQSTFGIGQGMTASTYDFTKLFTEAIQRAAQLGPEERRHMADLFFDPRLAARVGAAYFTPQAAQKLAQEQTGPRAITPAGTQGALDEELGRQLRTFHERASSVTNEIQRLGVAVGASGIIDGFVLLIDTFGAMGNAVGGVVGAFDTLPSAAKQATEAVLALRLAFMFLTRTRFGATFAEATGLSRLPGFGGTGATLARGELRAGTRAALDTVTGDLTRTNTALLVNSSEMATLKAKQLEADKIIAEETAAGNGQSERVLRTTERASRTLARITELQAQETRLETERLAQLEVQANLKAQILGLSSRRKFSDPEVIALDRRTSGTPGVVGESASIDERFAQQKAELATAAIAGQAAATGRLAAIQARATTTMKNLTGGQSTVVRRTLEATGATEEEIVAATRSTAATSGLAARFGGLAAGMRGFASGLGGLAAGLDPFLLAIIAIPEGIAAVKGVVDGMNKASKDAHNVLVRSYPGDPGTGIAQRLKDEGKAFAKTQEPPGILGSAYQHTLGPLVDLIAPPSKQNPATDALSRLGPAVERQAVQFRREAENLAKTGPGRARLAQALARFESTARSEVTRGFKGHPDQINATMTDIAAWAEATTNDIRKASSHNVPSQLQFLAGLSDQALAGWAKMYSTRSQIFGLQGGDLSGAIGATLLMAGRYRSSSDPAQIQRLQTAQQSVIAAVSKQAQNWIDASKTAGSSGAALKDLSQSAAGIQSARNEVKQWVERMRQTYGKIPGFMKAINGIAQDLYNQLAGLASNVLSEQLSAMQSQSTLAASQIGGFSPEADAARARKLLSGLGPQIAAAKKGGDWKQAQGLQAQYNNDARSLQKQQFDNAQSIADANAQVAEARIAPTNPEAQIQRARVVLSSANRKLAADRAAGVGQAQIANDYAAMLNDQNTLNQDIISNADQIFDANQQLAVSRITGIGPAADMARANQTLANANAKLGHDQAEHKGQAQIIQDYSAINDAQRGINSQIQGNAQQAASDAASLIQARSQLQQANTLDSVQAAREQLAADVQVLGTIRPGAFKTYTEYLAAYTQQQAKVVQDRRTVTEQYVSTQESTLQFLLHTQQISDAQYVARLQQLLKTARLTRAERQQITSEIFDATHATAVDLNVGNIHLPTSYEVRRSIHAAMRRAAGMRIPQNTGTVINHHVVNHVNVQVRVDKNADLKRFADTLDKALKSNLTGQAQASGLI